MPVFRLKVPVEVRNVIRQMPPELKRKLRAALEDILDDPTCGKALKEELEGYWTLRVGRTRIIYRRARDNVEILPSVPEKPFMKKRRGKFVEIRRCPDTKRLKSR
jgi:mRNA-degrading endonuclease RelE of RelBE toxin-antitoxin system